MPEKDMADMVTKQELEAAKIDVKNAGEAVNEEKVVKTRLGRSFKSIPLIVKEGEAKITQAAQTITSATASIVAQKNQASAAISEAESDVSMAAASVHQRGNQEIANLQNAIDIAAAAGAGENGWTAQLIVDASGKSQQEVNNNQQNINSTLFDRTRLVDDYGADPEGVFDSAAAFNTSLSASGYLNLRDGGVYLLKSALTRSGFLKVRGDAELIFDFNGDGLTVDGGGGDIDLGGATYNGASHLGRKRKSVVRLSNTGRVNGKNHKIINVYNDTDSVLALYLYNYNDSDFVNGLYKNITGLGNGVVGDAIGAVRAVYGSGNRDCGYLKISGGHVENINTVDISGVSIPEDADAFVTQTNTFKADLYVTDITYKNVGKRIVKTQNNNSSVTSMKGCVGSSAWVISDAGIANNDGMFAIASAYGGVLMYTGNTHIGGGCTYMIETNLQNDVIEFGNIYKPTYSAQIKNSHTRPYLHSSGDNSRYIHGMSIIENVARGSSVSNNTTSVVDIGNIIDHKVLGAELQLKNHMSIGNILTGNSLNAAILYQYRAEAWTVSNNIMRDWQDGVYIRDGMNVTKFAGSVNGNVTDNLSRNLLSEFSTNAIGKVGVSGNYSTIPSSGSKYSMLASTPTDPTLTAGGAPALPATPTSYISVTINGNQRYIPTYSQ